VTGANKTPLVINVTNPQRTAIQSNIITQASSLSFSGLQRANVEDVAQRIACRESGQIQFQARANGGQGPPCVEPDNDIGIMQIHSGPTPDLFDTNSDVVFAWQTNLTLA
jgi:hypothetical protein